MKLVSTGLALIGAAVLVGAAAFGISRLSDSAEAQTPPIGMSQYDELLAKELGISVEKLQEAQKAARQKLIDEAVASGKIRPELAEKMKGADRIFPGFPGAPGGPRFGAERSEMERKPGETKFGITDLFAIAADALGMTEDELKAELEDKSLADIAEEQGVSLDALKTKVTEALKARLAKAVADGDLTQEQANKISEMITDIVERLAYDAHRAPGALGFRFEFRGEERSRPAPFR